MTEATDTAAEAPERTPKGQLFTTWKDTDDWVEVPELQLRYKSLPFGAEGDENLVGAGALRPWAVRCPSITTPPTTARSSWRGPSKRPASSTRSAAFGLSRPAPPTGP